MKISTNSPGGQDETRRVVSGNDGRVVWSHRHNRSLRLNPISYQLYIELARAVTVTVGRLGTFRFPAGRYVYTGSARRHLEARIRRHLSLEKKLHWHIDYLLARREARITRVERFPQPECLKNRQLNGEILVSGFGASDCRRGCGSHLKYLGAL